MTEPRTSVKKEQKKKIVHFSLFRAYIFFEEICGVQGIMKLNCGVYTYQIYIYINWIYLVIRLIYIVSYFYILMLIRIFLMIR